MAADAGASRARGVVTHQISTDRERQVVAKRYLDARRGEAAREWRALQLLAEHAPRLAPEPISADLDADPPLIVMSLLPGEPLGGGPLSAEHERALAMALGRLWQSVPVGLVAPLPGELDAQANLVRLVREQAVGADPDVDADPVVQEALATSATWLTRVAGLTSAAGLDGDQFIEGFDLTAAERVLLADWRRLAALYWLLRLRPGDSGRPGPPGMLRRQAERLLAQL
jgi:Phosphotransferase enzyme family